MMKQLEINEKFADEHGQRMAKIYEKLPNSDHYFPKHTTTDDYGKPI